MNHSRRLKRALLVGAIASSLVVVVWAVYQFTVLWLRYHCADELGRLAQPIPVIVSPLARAGALEADTETTLDYATRAKLADVMARLAHLNRPRPLVVLELLLTKSEPILDPAEFAKAATKQMLPAPAPPQVQVPSFLAPEELTTATASGPLGASNIAKLGVLHREDACYSASDANGQNYWLVVARRQAQGDMGPFVSGASESQATQDIILIDAEGQIVSIATSNGGILFGKLPEPKGKADQLVFGPAALPGVEMDGKPTYSGTRSVWCIEAGNLKRTDEVVFEWTRDGAASQ